MRRKHRKTRKERKKQRKLLIISLLSLTVFLSLGYASFQTNININTSGTIKTCSIGRTWEYEFKPEAQEFKAPCAGTYKVELWGASGGYITAENGLGGYTSGHLNINKNFRIYLYIGEKGKTSNETSFNGGGGGGYGYADVYLHPENTPKTGSSGGGATDVRLTNGNWNEFTSLKSRIMVSSGGGGSQAYSEYSNANIGEHSFAGGLKGYSGSTYNSSKTIQTLGKGGTQTSGGQAGTPYNSSQGTSTNGGFGYGGSTSSWAGHVAPSGGGSGYYGGGAGAGSDGNQRYGTSGGNGGGGSSFISGHNGCDAISEQSTSNNIIHTSQSIHYSGKYFTETVMIDGAGYKWEDHKLENLGVVGMPTHSGIGTMTGNDGDGFAKITLISLNNE